MSRHDPIAYTYEADTHCPGCAEERFGRSERGFIGEHSTDNKGNKVGVIAPWDEWYEPSSDEPQTLTCGTCHTEIERYEP